MRVSAGKRNVKGGHVLWGYTTVLKVKESYAVSSSTNKNK